MRSMKKISLCLSILFIGAQSIVAAEPLKVFILAGQSNMQGHAHISTFDAMADDPKTASILQEMRNFDGTPRICNNVWISSIGCLGDAYSDLTEATGKLTTGFGAPDENIGPEYTFGITLEKVLNEPILIIKTAWGGRSLHTDFRPPSAGAYKWSDYEIARCRERSDDIEKIKKEKNEATGVYYRTIIGHVRFVLKDIKRIVPDYDEKQGYQLSGFVWFQGFNDYVSDWTYDKQMEPGGYDLYRDLMIRFIRDIRKDLDSPNLPFVIGVMGIGGDKEGSKPPQKYFRQAQIEAASIPEFRGNVVAVHTSPYWDDDLEVLQQRMEQLNEKLEQDERARPNATDEEKEQRRMKTVASNFTEEELKQLKGVSNGGYHYLGAAKILAPIGRAFALQVLEMRAPKHGK